MGYYSSYIRFSMTNTEKIMNISAVTHIYQSIHAEKITAVNPLCKRVQLKQENNFQKNA